MKKIYKYFFALVLSSVFMLSIGFVLADGAEVAFAEQENQDRIIRFGNTMAVTVDPLDETQIYNDNDSVEHSAGFRFADGNRSFSYCVIYPQDCIDAYMFVRVMGANKKIILRVDDGEEYDITANPTYVPDATMGEAASGVCVYSFMDYLNENAPTKLEIEFGCSGTDNGAQLWCLEFCGSKDYSSSSEPENAKSTITRIEARDTRAFVSEASECPENNYTMEGISWARYFDNHYYGVYKFDIKTSNPEKLELNIRMKGGYRLSVSSDLENWTDVGVAEYIYAWHTDSNNLGDYVYDISFLLENSPEFVYVKIGDATAAYGGWGGAFIHMVFREVESAQEERNTIVPDSLLYSVVLSDEANLIENHGSQAAGAYRAVEGAENYFTYKLALPQDTTSLSIAMEVEGAIFLDVSTDGTTFTRMKSEDFVMGSEYLTGAGYTLDLNSRLKVSNNVWLRFSDGNADNGKATILRQLLVFHNRSSVFNENKNSYENEIIEFCVGKDAWDEEKYLMVDHGGSFDWNNKFYDLNFYGIYKFTYAESAQGVKIIGIIGGSYLIEVSADGVTWSQRAVCPLQAVPNSQAQTQYVFIDVSDLMQNNAERTVYVRLSDAVPSNGWGGSMMGLGIVSYSGKVVGDATSLTPADSELPDKGCASSIVSGAPVFALLAFGVALLAIRKRRA